MQDYDTPYRLGNDISTPCSSSLATTSRNNTNLNGLFVLSDGLLDYCLLSSIYRYVFDQVVQPSPRTDWKKKHMAIDHYAQMYKGNALPWRIILPSSTEILNCVVCHTYSPQNVLLTDFNYTDQLSTLCKLQIAPRISLMI